MSCCPRLLKRLFVGFFRWVFLFRCSCLAGGLPDVLPSRLAVYFRGLGVEVTRGAVLRCVGILNTCAQDACE